MGNTQASADSKVWLFPHRDPDVEGEVGKTTFVFSTGPRTMLRRGREGKQGV